MRDVDEGTGADAYWRRRIWKRVATIAAGTGMNVLVAFVLFFAVYGDGRADRPGSVAVCDGRRLVGVA